MGNFFFANPVMLWALASLAVVAALYLFYRRYRPLAVTGLFLWGEPRREGEGGRTVERPLLSRAFLFDMLAAAFFALALAGPTWRGETGRPVAIILDDSFAMRARNCHRRAAELAAGWVAEAEKGGGGSLVVLAGRHLSILADFHTPAREKVRLLRSRLPAADASDLAGAIAFVRDIHGDGVDIKVATNQADISGAGSASRTVHVLEGKGGNLAFTQLWRYLRDDGERLVLSLINYGDEPAPVELTVRPAANADAPPLVSESFRLEAGETRYFEYALADAVPAVVVAASAPGDFDVIAADSVAFTPPPRRLRLTYGLDGLDGAEPFFRLALEAAGCLPAGTDADGSALPPDILVTRRDDVSGNVLTVQLSVPDNPGVFPPPYVVDSASPLCRDLDLSAVPWVVAARDRPEGVERAYVMAGDTPLYWRSRPDRLHLNLVPERCQIVHEPAWPALIANLASEAAALAPGLGKTSYRPGEALRYRGDARRLELAPAAGETTPISLGREPILPLESGLYTLRDGGAAVGELAILPLYGAASDSAGLAPADRTVLVGGSRERKEEGFVDLTWLFLVLGLAFAAGNWLHTKAR